MSMSCMRGFTREEGEVLERRGKAVWGSWYYDGWHWLLCPSSSEYPDRQRIIETLDTALKEFEEGEITPLFTERAPKEVWWCAR